VLGAQGKDAELAKLLERFVTEWEDDPQIFYEDLDISPCLKRPGLKAFTDKYPAKKPVNPAKEGK
jgi:hypothetical protein